MLSFVNDFQEALEADLEVSGLTLPLAGASRLDFSSGQEYLLTLTDSADATTRTKMEIVRVSEGLSLRRAQEGTSSLYWPEGTIVMCSITAGGLAELRAPAIHTAAPSAPPPFYGAEWLVADEGYSALYKALGAGSTFDWVKIAGSWEAYLWVDASVAGVVDLPALVERVSVGRNSGGLGSAHLRLPVAPAWRELYFTLEIYDHTQIPVVIDTSLYPGGISGASVQSSLSEDVTVTRDFSSLMITALTYGVALTVHFSATDGGEVSIQVMEGPAPLPETDDVDTLE